MEGERVADKVIFHVDVNSAFLSWEAVHRLKDLGETLDLRTVPSAVGGDISKRHGVILAKSIPAKAFNVRTGEPIVDALRKCPNLVLVQPDHELYKRNSEAFITILRKYSDTVEQYSIDEAFVDMTGTGLLFGEPIEAANRIREEVYDTLGFTVNIGISSNKLLAKMASDFKKPNLVHTLFPSEIPDKMWPLPVRDLFLVGKSSEKALGSMGIRTIGDLANTDVSILKSVLKKQGETIWNFANGHDFSLVEPKETANKGYANSTTIAFDVTDATTAKIILLSLAENIGGRLRQDGVRVGSVSVSIRFSDLSNVSHQCILDNATDITDEIHAAACRLFDELWNGTPIRLLGIYAGRIEANACRQLSMFDSKDYEKLQKLDKAVDSIRARFGNDAVKRAAFMDKDAL